MEKKILYAVVFILIMMNIASCAEPGNVADDTPAGEPSQIAAVVNGETIYEYQLGFVISQLPGGEISREQLLENSIRELVLIQEGKRLKISVSRDDLDGYVKIYKLSFPEIYEDAVRIYGEEEFNAGLLYRLLYNKTKTYIIDKIILLGLKVDDDVLRDYIKNTVKIENLELNENTYNLILSSYKRYYSDLKFEEYIGELRRNAEVEYFNIAPAEITAAEPRAFINTIPPAESREPGTVIPEGDLAGSEININIIEMLTSATLFITDSQLFPSRYWDWDEVIDYFGPEIAPGYIPDELTKNSFSLRAVYRDDGTLARDLLSMTYSDNPVNSDLKKSIYISASLRGLKIEMTCLWPTGAKTSVINGTEVMLGSKDNQYFADFKTGGITYYAEATGISFEEFFKVISSLIK